MSILEFNGDDILTETSLSSTMRLDLYETDDRSDVTNLLFKLASYDIAGNLLEVADLTDQLQLCGGNLIQVSHWRRFGTNYENTCNLPLEELLIQPTVFYELFYVDQDMKWFPVPVKLLTYQSGGVYSNLDAYGQENFAIGTMTLNHRFFMVDTLSSIPAAGEDPLYIQYAKTVTLRVSMQDGSSTKIYPPYLVISYAQRKVQTLLVKFMPPRMILA